MITSKLILIGLHRRGPRFFRLRYYSVGKQIEEETIIKSLTNHLFIKEDEAKYLVLKHPVIKKLHQGRLQDLVETVCDLGFTTKDLIEEPSLFGILPITLRFRFKVLEECGVVNIARKDLISYLPLVKQKTIGELRSIKKIPQHFNVENRLASYMTKWPTSLTTLVMGDVNELNLYSLRLKIIQRYLELILDLTQEEFDRGIQTYPTIKHRPLKVINETLHILQCQIMIPNNKLKNNLYLVHVDPINLKNIINNFRSIGGIDIKEVIRMYPKIATKRYDALVEIRNILQEYGINNEAQIKCFDIYTLGSSTVRDRLEKAKNIPEFNTFFQHPRFLKVIHYNTTAVKRLNKLYTNNKKCLSLNILAGSSDRYELFEKSPGDRLGKGKDLIFCIQQSLGKKFNTKDIRSALRRHPFWINTPLVQVKFVHQQLSLHFSEDDIYQNCPVLLYPWNKIKAILDLFDNKRNKQPVFSDFIEMDKLSQSQKLSLVMYLLEKKHYFTGNGVWTEEKSKTIEIRPVEKMLLHN
ncbi:hypothetical protein K1T71_003285 [Dendrolimus kikuchii]|uniref:Uncharacterized protein n=1 Tax=Dendrolimus kikuchii TaxID=765133 RepID=A0ACC1DBG8_9NEOP|nr:hypothetical protein K1T71_003285 [Dendrolimus kikuchii]